MEQIISTLTNLIISVIQTLQYFGVFLFMMLESCLIPIPSEITLPFAGFLAQAGKLNLYGVIAAGVIGDSIGAMLCYAIGFWGEEHVVRGFIRKYGKFVLVSEHEYDSSEKWFRRFGPNIIFFGRLLPVVRTFISLPAGISKMNFKKFLTFTVLGSIIWCAALTYLGFYLGSNWSSLEGVYRKFEYGIIGILVLLVAFYIYKKLAHLKKGK